MAENQSLNAPKQEEEKPIEQEEEGGEEKLLPTPQNSLIPIGVVSDCCTNEVLMTIKGSQAEPHVDYLSNSADLDVKPVNATSLASPEPTEFKGQFVELHQEVLASAKVQATQAQAYMQLQAECPPALEIPPIIIKQPMPSAISPMPLQQKLPALEQNNIVYEQEVNQDSSSDEEIKPTCFTVKAPANDGYNWRKYGHKLVKSSESSRSYYRCTTIDCHAKKKVECCDHSGKLIEISYKGRHNHDPPREVRCHKARKLASSTMLISSSEPGGDSGLIDCPVTVDFYSDPSTFRREPGQPTPGYQLSAKECDQVMSIKSEEYFDEPHSEHRMKGRAVTYPASLFKAVKESKVVVQAPGDIGILGDGYRWRKYGQKMVKGNPNPRSYYKCTSAGCPVRKHVERSIEDTTTFVITYEGKHDHDMPIPKKRHGPPNASLFISAAPAMNSPGLKESKALENHKISAQWSMDLEDPLTKEKETECGGQKVLKSAQTLLSIGIELRPY